MLLIVFHLSLDIIHTNKIITKKQTKQYSTLVLAQALYCQCYSSTFKDFFKKIKPKATKNSVRVTAFFEKMQYLIAYINFSKLKDFQALDAENPILQVPGTFEALNFLFENEEF